MSFNNGFATENFSIMVHQHAETPEIGDGHSPHPQGTMPKGELHTTRPEIRPSLEDTFLVSSPWVGFTPYWNGMKWAKDWNMDFPSKKTHGSWILSHWKYPMKKSQKMFVCLIPMWSCPKMGYTPHMAILCKFGGSKRTLPGSSVMSTPD